MFAVIHSKRIVHVQASNCVQQQEWIETLNKLLQITSSTKMQTMPYCGELNRYSISTELTIKLDPDRQLERIYSLLIANQDNIDSLMDSCTSQVHSIKIWKDQAKSHFSCFVIENFAILQRTLSELKKCLSDLQLQHSGCSNTFSGSELDPIDFDD